VARHYLDHASTAPARPQVADALAEWYRTPAGDPGRIHTEGLVARDAVEQARQSVAHLIGARSREVVFTSGATEAITAAIEGTAGRGDHLVVPAVEHSAVRFAADRLVARGTHEVSVVGCDRTGRVDADELVAAIRPTTALVNLQWGNHEVGTTQPVEEVVEACRDAGVLVHVDATQAVGRVPVDVGALGADLLSFSAHKFGGPTGVGALVIRRGLRIEPLLVGDDRERARRAGFENVSGIVALGAVAEVLGREGQVDAEGAEQRRLAARLIAASSSVTGIEVFGDSEHRLPHIVCLGVDGVEPQGVLLGLDQRGIACHSGSACSSEELRPSPVLEAMGVAADRSLRASVGWNTTDADVDAFTDALPVVVEHLRALAAG
jgi:cysteine desulfurase